MADPQDQVTDFAKALPRGRVVVENKGGLLEVTSDLPESHQARLLRAALEWVEMPMTPPGG